MSHAAFAALLGADHVVTDEAERRLYAQDVMQWPGAPVPELVVKPGSTAEVAAVTAVPGKWFGRNYSPSGRFCVR